MKHLKQQLNDGVRDALKTLSFPDKPFTISPSKNPDFGDLSTNVALILTKDLKRAPIQIAEEISGILNQQLSKHIDSISVTPPGFINFTLSPSFYQSNIQNILNAGEDFGRSSIGKGKTANVEFVSANPTGPLTVGHGRQAVLGDSVASILEWNSFNVTREYYYNDAGRQMRILGQSVEARYFEALGKEFEFPEDGYQGDYIIDIAQSIIKNYGKGLNSGDKRFRETVEIVIFSDIKNTLSELGIIHDQFSNEKSFYDNGAIDQLLSDLKAKELIYESDGATWLKTSALGKDQDRVYIKSSGEPTYRLPDTAYHRNKVERNFDEIIDIFGADHADTYPDVLAALDALDVPVDHIRVLIHQFVTLLRDGEKVKMSTRKANFVTLEDLVKEVGKDVVRYFFIMRNMSSHLDFDLDLAADQSDKNPVFYLQYAHARIANIIKHGESLGHSFSQEFDPTLISEKEEFTLIKHLMRFPELSEQLYESLEPQMLATYLQELAAHFHKFYGKCKVITDDSALTQSRLALITCAKLVLSNGLHILGISTPDRM
ncbi:MAG: arginine--tRNA ligase [Candidatus Marinimicrobia bacterium]|nr:arginine--tRNA ligase [Candidatus Neomarinimicrobiota bacterium]